MMEPDRVQAGITQQNFNVRARRWIAFKNRCDVFPYRFEESDHGVIDAFARKSMLSPLSLQRPVKYRSPDWRKTTVVSNRLFQPPITGTLHFVLTLNPDCPI